MKYSVEYEKYGKKQYLKSKYIIIIYYYYILFLPFCQWKTCEIGAVIRKNRRRARPSQK